MSNLFLFSSFLASRGAADREARPPKRGLVGRTSGAFSDEKIFPILY